MASEFTLSPCSSQSSPVWDREDLGEPGAPGGSRSIPGSAEEAGQLFVASCCPRFSESVKHEAATEKGTTNWTGL